MTLEGLECVNSPFSPHLLPCWGSRGKLGTLPGGIIFTKRPPYTSLVHLRMCHSVEMLMTMKVSWTGLPPHLKPIYTPGGNSTPHVQQNFYFCIAMGKCTQNLLTKRTFTVDMFEISGILDLVPIPCFPKISSQLKRIRARASQKKTQPHFSSHQPFSSFSCTLSYFLLTSGSMPLSSTLSPCSSSPSSR